ncbi:hypothetical protein LUZ60_001202 [Juncus effusus]|nr:hypothetical protein LUZ60_001202 [Juncus effusus]
MASSFAKSILALLVLVTFVGSSIGARPRILDLWIPDEPSLSYHWGGVLQGNIPVSIVWYGKFEWTQKSIIIDFIYSLTSYPWQQSPSVSQWWNKIDQFYLSKVNWNNVQTGVNLVNQMDKWYTMGNSLAMWQISQLASSAGTPKGGITLVLTAEDVTVEGFCSSHCGTHGVDWNSGSAFIWVGNSNSQCPGQCAWPFHQPQYGPQTPPLIAPNGDVGIDGMIINVATLMAGTITNPWGYGYYQGPQEAPLEACTACAGVFGPGGFPGYPGQLKMDWSTGASYNANGANGRKYLLPAVMDPAMSYCSTLS